MRSMNVPSGDALKELEERIFAILGKRGETSATDIASDPDCVRAGASDGRVKESLARLVDERRIEKTLHRGSETETFLIKTRRSG